VITKAGLTVIEGEILCLFSCKPKSKIACNW